MASWLDLYVSYAKENEAPLEYHWWTGLAVMGAALRRNVYHQRGPEQVFPSIWMVLVGPSGSGKGWALRTGMNVMTKLDCIRILPDRGSAEAIVKDLSSPDEYGNPDATGVFYAPELTSFMDKREHAQGMVPLLLRLADFPDRWTYHTLKGGRLELRNVAVTFMGGSTIELIQDSIPATALKTGFLARYICVDGYKTERKIVPEPWFDKNLEIATINELNELSLLKGPMKMPRPAQEWWIAWYYRHKAKFMEESSERVRAFLERKPTFLTRIAMLLSIASLRRLEFSIEAFEEADRKLEEVDASLNGIYEQIEATSMGKEMSKILGIIYSSHDGITHSDLLRKVSLVVEDATVFRKIMTVLVESRRVKVLKRKSDGELIYRKGEEA